MAVKVLITGATGYIGGRLVPLVLKEGYEVRVLARQVARLSGHAWAKQIEIAEGDALEVETLAPALKNVQVAFYLIHSMAGSGESFQQKDIEAAHNFGQAAKQAGVEQIIFLGGLGKAEGLSKHLQSRHETGDALRKGGVPVTEFRAAVIVGSGGISFELIRYLTERLPVMVTPRWVHTHTQPIAVDDMLLYLIAAIQCDEAKGKTFEVGGADVLTYADMMRVYAELRGLKRRMIPVPVLTPRLSSYWVNLVTPIPVSVARPLVEGLRNEVIVTDHSAEQVFPDIHPISYRQAVTKALNHTQNGAVATSWTDALSSTAAGKIERFRAEDKEGMLIDKRQAVVNADPQTVFATVLRIGGRHGWYYGDFLWQLRGLIDRIIGGPGLRRVRRHPDQLQLEDVLDFWRVEALEQDKVVRLRAEMILPGRAWLEFKTDAADPAHQTQTVLTQTAFFKSHGLLGWAYWHFIFPIHCLVFAGMIDGIKRRAEAVGKDKVRVISVDHDLLTKHESEWDR